LLKKGGIGLSPTNVPFKDFPLALFLTKISTPRLEELMSNPTLKSLAETTKTVLVIVFRQGKNVDVLPQVLENEDLRIPGVGKILTIQLICDENLLLNCPANKVNAQLLFNAILEVHPKVKIHAKDTSWWSKDSFVKKFAYTV